MNKAISFVWLDVVTVKPYFTLKNLAIMLSSPLIIMFMSGGGGAAGGIFMAFAALYVSYPFAICDKNGMDALYTTLSIPRGTVVLGRYLFTLAFNLCAALIAIMFTSLYLLVTRTPLNFSEILIVTLCVFAVVCIIESIQIPIYFKLGYEKGKLLAYLPFFIPCFAVVPISHALSKAGDWKSKAAEYFGWFAENPHIAIILGIILCLVSMTLSYLISLVNYLKRDF